MRAALRLAAPSLALLLAGCPAGEGSDDDSAADDDTGTDDDSAADDDTAPPACTDTASGEFPADSVEIAWDDGDPSQDMGAYEGYYIPGYYGNYDLYESPQWEAVRFDLGAPATVWGARVVWSNLVAEEETPLPIGAYPDFGGNGFDFDRWNPLWEGTRCVSAGDPRDWVDYVFDAPIEVTRPGLLYVGHFKGGSADPMWGFDEDYLGEGDCASFDDCHSAWNYPDADDEVYYHGSSFPFAYDYGVRLRVTFHDTVPAQDQWFQVDPGLAASSRVAWGDYDNDGDDDLMTNGPTLYRNDGGTFADVSSSAWPGGLAGGASSGGVWGDYDNDGCLDYFGFNSGYVGQDVLLHGECDGTFTDRILDSGIDDTQSAVDCDAADPEQAPTEAAAWVDLDADGFLDLWVGNHNCWTTYTFYADRIWHNRGDGTFEEWGSEHGFTTARLPTRGVSPADADKDGDVDVLVSDYVLERNLYYENLGDGDFVEIGRDNGLAGYGDYAGAFTYYYGHTIGSVWLDVENDGDWDLFEANLAHPRFYDFSDRSMLLVNDGSGMFTDEAAARGILYKETHSSPSALDFDLDGDTDLFVTCVYDGRVSELYRNDGQGGFEQVNYESGAVVENGWGSAVADYDRDGDPDILAYSLFRNDTAAEGRRFLQVRPFGGITSNWAAIGARVEVAAGGKTLMAQVDGGHGTGCQDSQTLTFGLGTLASADGIVVTYPGGAQVSVEGPIAADQRLWVHEDGTVETAP
ncbi:CRTAC1 family protein [Myxococcota bacterium]|nr:CRTAC1 family protein [Myxococcota bacterium]